MIDHALEILRSVWLWLVIGVFVSAAIETYLPEAALAQIAAWGSVPSALVALLVSLPLYVCAVASVPIAAALVTSGLPAGAALVFLMAGPATNVATIGAVWRTFGPRTLFVYLGTIVVGSVGFAAAFDALPLAARQPGVAHHEHGVSWLSQLSALVLIALIVWFAVSDWRTWRRRRRSGHSAAPGYRVAVDGMTCNDCVNRLERTLYGTAGVHAAVVRLERNEALVHGTLDPDELRAAIGQAGFQAGRIAAVENDHDVTPGSASD